MDKDIQETVAAVSNGILQEARFQQAKNMYDSGKKDIAVPLLQTLADEGHAGALYLLGVYYVACMTEKGCKIPLGELVAKSFECYRRSAEIGYAEAQYNLGEMYFNGTGGDKDYAKAIEWYRKAAEQGHIKAQSYLGACYALGDAIGIQKDMVKAAYWFHKAAVQGECDSQYQLGRCYFYGEGHKKDYEEAFEWFYKAAEQNLALAQYYVGHCFYNGYGVEEDEEEAVEWYRKAADQGIEDAQKALDEIEDE